MPLILIFAVALLPIPGDAAGIAATEDRELRAAVSCVISAWNAYDADASRECYSQSAVAVWNHEPKPIDWDFVRRLRAFDSGARSRFRFKINKARHPKVEFTLLETNHLIEALGLKRVTARWRYTVQGGRVVEEELLEGDGAFRAALQELTSWGRQTNPEGWASVTDQKGNIRFDGATAVRLIALAREWSRSRTPTRK